MAEYHQVFSDPLKMHDAVELARQACEAENGNVPMVCASTRQTHYKKLDEQGRETSSDVYELWATFVPAPPEPAAITLTLTP